MSAPAIAAINPNAGPVSGGTALLIIGSNLLGASSVTFGTGANTVVATPTSSTATTVSVVTPAWTFAAGPARVTVTTPNGSSTQPVFFNYTSISVPVLTSVIPNHGAQSGGNVVTITGSSLLYTTSVTITQGSTTVPVSFFAVLSDTLLAALLPPAPVGSGPASIAVSNGAGTSATTLTYTYDAGISIPVVTAVVPNSGSASGGNTVTITGTGFTYATVVNFGPNASPSFSVASDTSITATVPGGSGTVTVTVSGPAGVGVTGVPYTYNEPSITSLTPNSGPLAGGNTVTITGTSLESVTAVTFDGIPATSFTILSPTAVNAIAPAGAAAGPVNVTVSAGAFTSAPATYTYIAQPAPTAISPTSGVISGGTTVAVTGTGLTGTSSITFGGTPATNITVISDTEVDAVTPAHAVGTVPVTIVTPGGTNSSLSFSYQSPPTITSVSPAQGPTSGGTTVSINGAGFINATGVFFGAVPATSFTLVSDNLINAVSPAGTGIVSIIVATAAAVSNGALFQYIATPTLTAISPTGGSIVGGNNVTLTGSGFTSTQNVFFGTLAATFTVLDDFTISAVAPTVGTAGPVSVTVQNVGGTSAPQTYTYS